MAETDQWQAETYKRLLTVIGGQEERDEFKRAQALLAEFNHFFPKAKAEWDAYCASMGVTI